MIKKTKISLIIIISFLLIIISYFTFGENIRRKALTYIFVTHDYYQLKILTHDLQNKNFLNVSKKINNYINISKKLSSEKSYMLPGIYNTVEHVVSKAIEQEDFNYLEKPLEELVKMEPKLYKPKVWLARALSDNNYQKSIILLEKAISMSPSEEDAYREILRIAQLREDKVLTDKYCNIFFKSQLGGNTDGLDYAYLFNSNNLKNFAIKFRPIIKNNFFYYHSGVEIGNFINYEFTPDKPININGLNLYFSFLPGMNIIIKEIIIHTNNNKQIIPSDDLIVTSDSSYIEDIEEGVSVMSPKQGDDVIRISFKKKKTLFNNIERIQLNINFKKMKLANKNYCK